MIERYDTEWDCDEISIDTDDLTGLSLLRDLSERRAGEHEAQQCDK